MSCMFNLQFVQNLLAPFQGQSQLKVCIQIAPKQNHFDASVNQLLVLAMKYVTTRKMATFVVVQ